MSKFEIDNDYIQTVQYVQYDRTKKLADHTP